MPSGIQQTFRFEASFEEFTQPIQLTIVFPEATNDAEAEEEKVVKDEKEQTESAQSETTQHSGSIDSNAEEKYDIGNRFEELMNQKFEDSASLPPSPQKLAITKVSAKGAFSIEASQRMYF